MVTAKNKRLGQIVDYLRASSSPIQVAELAELLDCSNRTIHRHLEELRSQSVPITSYLGPGGGLVLAGERSPESETPDDDPTATPVPRLKKSFVGRKTESESLDQALDRAIAGTGGIVALIGEAGIGKTRIAEEFATRGTDLGITPIWCTSQESQSTPPYWPWIQAIRSLNRTVKHAGFTELPAEVIQRVSSLADASFGSSDQNA
ncbi:MAG: AAA family ATPase, partial [Dehalococcoidia bacterium]